MFSKYNYSIINDPSEFREGFSKFAIIIKTIFFDFVIMLNGKEGYMGNQSVISIEAVIDYIESHLDEAGIRNGFAEAVHYSKYPYTDYLPKP